MFGNILNVIKLPGTKKFQRVLAEQIHHGSSRALSGIPQKQLPIK